MKKLFSVFLSIVLFLSLVACKSHEPTNSSDSSFSTTSPPLPATSPSNKDLSSLPGLYSFETLMNNAVINYYKDANIDARTKGYLLKNYKIGTPTTPNTTFEHVISCTYGPNNSLGLLANANNEKVVHVYTFMLIDTLKFDAKDIANFATFLMIPVSLYNDAYTGWNNLMILEQTLVKDGHKSNDGNSSTITIDRINYTLTITDTTVSFSIDAREHKASSSHNNENIRTTSPSTDPNIPIPTVSVTPSTPAADNNTHSTGQDALYDTKINEYRQALTMGKDAFDAKYDYGSDYSSINALMVRFCYDYGGAIGYSTFDIDKNGIAELIFSNNNDYVIDIYTVHSGKLVKLFENCYFGERSRVHILADGRLLSEGSDSAFSGSCELFEINSSGKLTSPAESYYYDERGRNSYMTDYTYTTKDNYYNMINGWKNNSVFAELKRIIVAQIPVPGWNDLEISNSDIAHTHSYGSWANADNSSHSKTCTCGQKETEDHTFDTGKVTKAPTTTTTGVKTYTCTKCAATKIETIAKLQHTHSYGSWTNADNSSHIKTCTCGQKETEDHTFDAGKVTKAPTTTTTGVKTYTCTKCAATKTETIAKLQHTHSYGDWSADHNGTSHTRSCSCGGKETSPHSFDSGKITTKPTYSSTGIMTYTCYTCSATKTETIPKLDLPATQEVNQKRICWACSYDDGTVKVTIHRGEVTNASWTCSSCGTYNQSTYEMN